MNCPVCNKGLIVLELNQVEIDFCYSCKGIWLDAGELELLLEGASEKDHLLSSFHSEKRMKEKMKKCPICSRKMEKILCGREDEKIRIDKCKKNDGYWFDTGELQTIIKMACSDKESRVLNLLKDMFGGNK